MRIIAIVVAVGIIGFLIGLSGALGAGPSCHTQGAGAFTGPDNACTPGAYRVLSRSAVCTPKDRPGLSAADHRKILREYGVPRWTGRDGELDHRVPVFLGGLTVEDNIWPERGPDPRRAPNRKDDLERLVRFRVCGSSFGFVPARATMRVRTAVRLFLADWRHAYQALVPLRSPVP